MQLILGSTPITGIYLLSFINISEVYKFNNYWYIFIKFLYKFDIFNFLDRYAFIIFILYFINIKEY